MNYRTITLSLLVGMMVLVLIGLLSPQIVSGNDPAQQTATPTPVTAVPTPIPAGSPNNGWTPVTQTFDGVEMVLVPAGCFTMGSDNEKPAHKVCFEEPFWMDQTEVTNAQFAAFKGQASSASAWTDDNRPREQITWTEANSFCESRGARLPTEAEWEYAARGPENWVYPWGNEWDGRKVVWNRSISEGTAPVGSKPEGRSWVGALDLSGNVWEWVADWYGPYTSEQQTNPTGPVSSDYRVLRGGAWAYDSSVLFRASYRSWSRPFGGVLNLFGFRCVRSR